MLADEQTPGIHIIRHHGLAHILFEVSNPNVKKSKHMKSFRCVHSVELITSKIIIIY